MKRKRNPSMDGAREKIRRAKSHAQALETLLAVVQGPNRYRFAGEVQPDGIDHIYWPIDPPAPPDDFAAVLGDCIHNVRSALDHLAHDLVLANHGDPTRSTQFPIRPSSTRLNPFTGEVEPHPPHVSGGIHPDAARLIEQVQPYRSE